MMLDTPGPRFTFRRPEDNLGSLPAFAAARLIEAVADIAVVVDEDGVIRDVAVSEDHLARAGFGDWLDAPMLDTVAADSRPKVEDMLASAHLDAPPRWREINHVAADGSSAPFRYAALPGGRPGRTIALGRDLRSVQDLQQRLVQAQQAMERDYARLRDAETRYRVLFQMSGEAVVILDAATRRIVEVNPAGARILGFEDGAVVGLDVERAFAPDNRAQVTIVVEQARATGSAEADGVALLGGRATRLSATVFRQARATYVLLRIAADGPTPRRPADDAARILEVVNRIPDGFVLTDTRFSILSVNQAFLEYAQLGASAEALGRPLEAFLGRTGVDLPIVAATLRENGVVRNFATVVRGPLDLREDVEVSAVAAEVKETTVYGFVIRPVGRRLPAFAPLAVEGRQLPRSVEQLTELVGRVALKDIVRETTDLIERLCIEAALELTRDNRASAAEILGLSRQSLYSKLHRYGLGNLGAEEA